MFYAESPGALSDIGTSTISNLYGLHVSNLQSFTGTISNTSGIWIDAQSGGAASKRGIVLNGDGEGADIVFGSNHNARIYSSSGQLYVQDVGGNETIISPP